MYFHMQLRRDAQAKWLVKAPVSRLQGSSATWFEHQYLQWLVESIKTTFMEDASTIVLEKIKNISESKTEKWSDVSTHI